MVKTIEGSSGAPKTPSIDPDEVAKFSAMAADWWDPRGKFRPLHKFNPVRLGFIRDTAEAHFGLEPGAKKPLEGLRLLDIGCDVEASVLEEPVVVAELVVLVVEEPFGLLDDTATKRRQWLRFEGSDALGLGEEIAEQRESDADCGVVPGELADPIGVLRILLDLVKRNLGPKLE